MLRIARMSLMAALCLVLLVPVAAQATSTDTYEHNVHHYTDVERAKRGLAATAGRACLDAFAEKQARKMRSAGRLSHQSMTKIASDCHLRSVGENVASGFSSGKLIVAAWMASSAHRANILRSSYRYIGIGAVKDSNGKWWVSQVFGTRR